MTLDIDALRADTPGSEHVTHLNNAGSSLQPMPVAVAVRDYLEEELLRGGYETADARRSEIEDFYPAVADLIGGRADEIGFLDSATRAWQLVFYSLGLAAGDQILTTTTEYHSNFLAYLHLAQSDGVEIVVAPDAPSGEVDVAALAAMVGPRTKLISLNHIPTNLGLVNPAAEIGVVAREAGVPFLLDACQSVGQLPVDVRSIGCDFLTATGRKFMRGPRGTGFVWVARERIESIHPVVVDGHSAAWTSRHGYELEPNGRRFEVWEQNFAAKVGLGVAARYASAVGVEAGWDRIQALAGSLRAMLNDVPGVTTRDRGSVQGGIVTFTVDGVHSSDVSRELRSRYIHTSFATVASARVDMEERGLESVVRASVHYFNSDEELETLVAAVAEIAAL
ncbi:MAG: aminotransferase class V-fold PLP-dependent enzyme [Acidimicrobiia bacterium]|nr:aminotransferase class V-fold PLP-dependent enzyme [Acidimicrobiia bacterium]